MHYILYAKLLLYP